MTTVCEAIADMLDRLEDSGLALVLDLSQLEQDQTDLREDPSEQE